MNPLTHLFTTDAALVRQALAERPEAFEALVLRHQRKAYAVARSLGVPSEAVEDVLQESLLRAFRDLPRLRKPGAFGAWLLNIVRNAARDHASRRARSCAAPLTEDLEAEGRDPADAEFQEYLWRRVAELPEATREAVFLYYHDGESTRSVARTLGISVSAVKSRLEHGRKLLREKLWREMARCFRGSILPPREWRRKARRLALSVLVAGSAAWTPARGAGAGSVAAASTGVVLMSAKKLVLLVASVVLLLLGGGAWLADPWMWWRDARPGGLATRPGDSAAFKPRATRSSPRIASGDGTVSVAALAPQAALGSIAGTVFLIDREARAAGATVAAILEGARRHASEVTTAADGTYRLADLAPGIYRVGAWMESWSAADSSGEREKIEVRAGETAAGADLVLVPGTTVTVEVVSLETGEPVAGATVDCRGRRFGTTDERGLCRLEGLPARPRLTVTAEGFSAVSPPVQAVPGEEAFLRVALTPGGIVEGRVTRPEERPAAGATVETSMSAGSGSWFSLQARADEEGRYRLSGISLAQRSFTVTASLGALHKASATVSGFPEGESRIELDLRLAGGQVLAGRVVDLEGSPVEGAEVVLDPWREASARTDAAGAFRIAGAPEDLKNVLVRKRGFSPAKVAVLGLPAEEREALDVVLEPANSVGGTVVDIKGRPVPAASVHVWTEEHSFFGPVTTDRAGLFQLDDLPVKLRDLWASKPGYLESRGNRATAGRMDHRLVLEEGGQIQVLVVERATGAPLRDLTVKVLHGKTARQAGKDPDSLGAAEGHNGICFSDPRGLFTVRGLAPGTFYQLVAIGEGHIEGVTEDIEAWPESEARFPIRIAVDAGRTLRGKAVSDSTGEPLQGIRVRHLGGPLYDPSAGRYSWFIEAYQSGNPTFRTAVTGADGTFAIGGLCERPGTLLLEKPGFARTALSPFVAPEDGATQVFRLPGEAVLEGVVTTAAGAPIPGIEVTVTQGTQRFPAAKTDPQGRYRIDGLPAGDVRVEVARSWGLSTREDQTLRAGEVTVLDFVEPPGSIAGAVTAGSDPVPLARISLRRSGSEREEAFVTSDAGGGYRIEGLRPGAYDVSAAREDDWRDSIVIGPGSTVEVGAGETRCDLAFGTAGLRLYVVDRSTGRPPAAAYVTLSVEKDRWRSAGRKFLRRGDSSIDFDLLPPGVYSATAWTEPFGRLIGWMVPVVLAAGQTTDMTLLAGGASEVKIMVLDAASGAVVSGALVRLQARGAPVQLEMASGADGTARLPSVPPAVWDLAVQAAGRRGLAETLDVHGERLERTVKLESAP